MECYGVGRVHSAPSFAFSSGNRVAQWTVGVGGASSAEPAEPAELFRRGWVAMPGAASEPTVVIMDSPE